MNLAEIEPALCTIAATVTGVTSALCVFENAPRPMSSNGVTVLLSWVSRTGVGVDATRYDYEAAADPLDEMTPTTEGPREAVVQIAVEVIADQRAGHNAAALVEKARTRLRWPRVLDALEAVDLALASVGPATQADYTADGRLVSRSLFEVRLNGVSRETDENGRTSYIATVEAVSTITAPDGTTLPDSIQPAG